MSSIFSQKIEFTDAEIHTDISRRTDRQTYQHTEYQSIIWTPVRMYKLLKKSIHFESSVIYKSINLVK